jgi:hypothetical protein
VACGVGVPVIMCWAYQSTGSYVLGVSIAKLEIRGRKALSLFRKCLKCLAPKQPDTETV